MQLALSAEDAEFRDEMREFFTTQIPEEIRDAVRDQRELTKDQFVASMRILNEHGLAVPNWPVEWGGRDWSPLRRHIWHEEMQRACVPAPLAFNATMIGPVIAQFGSQELKERFLPATANLDIWWSQGFSEPDAGSDLASLRTRAERVEGGWRLTGQKVWTSMAERADWGICLARTDPDAPKHRGITYFLVDMRTSPGIEVRPLREITGKALFNEVFLDDVFVPDDLVVGAVGDGWRLARTTLANERVAMATSRLSTSTERAVELAAEGITPAQRVAVGHSIALSTVCSLLGVRSTLRTLAGQGPGAESSVAKLLGVRNRQDGAELVVTLHGDRVVLDDDEQVRADVSEMLNTRCLSIAGGTTQVLRNVAGERILGLPR